MRCINNLTKLIIDFNHFQRSVTLNKKVISNGEDALDLTFKSSDQDFYFIRKVMNTSLQIKMSDNNTFSLMQFLLNNFYLENDNNELSDADDSRIDDRFEPIGDDYQYGYIDGYFKINVSKMDEEKCKGFFGENSGKIFSVILEKFLKYANNIQSIECAAALYLDGQINLSESICLNVLNKSENNSKEYNSANFLIKQISKFKKYLRENMLSKTKKKLSVNQSNIQSALDYLDSEAFKPLIKHYREKGESINQKTIREMWQATDKSQSFSDYRKEIDEERKKIKKAMLYLEFIDLSKSLRQHELGETLRTILDLFNDMDLVLTQNLEDEEFLSRLKLFESSQSKINELLIKKMKIGGDCDQFGITYDILLSDRKQYSITDETMNEDLLEQAAFSTYNNSSERSLEKVISSLNVRLYDQFLELIIPFFEHCIRNSDGNDEDENFSHLIGDLFKQINDVSVEKKNKAFELIKAKFQSLDRTLLSPKLKDNFLEAFLHTYFLKTLMKKEYIQKKRIKILKEVFKYVDKQAPYLSGDYASTFRQLKQIKQEMDANALKEESLKQEEEARKAVKAAKIAQRKLDRSYRLQMNKGTQKLPSLNSQNLAENMSQTNALTGKESIVLISPGTFLFSERPEFRKASCLQTLFLTKKETRNNIKHSIQSINLDFTYVDIENYKIVLPELNSSLPHKRINVSQKMQLFFVEFLNQLEIDQESIKKISIFMLLVLREYLKQNRRGISHENFSTINTMVHALDNPETPFLEHLDIIYTYFLENKDVLKSIFLVNK